MSLRSVFVSVVTLSIMLLGHHPTTNFGLTISTFSTLYQPNPYFGVLRWFERFFWIVVTEVLASPLLRQIE